MTEKSVRFETLAEGCGNIIDRANASACSSTVCESVEELEQYHDALAIEVINLAGMLQSALTALASAQPSSPLLR